MLAYILAIALAITSLSLYLSAFFLPELHRKDDFLWSGVGLFYALILWLCAGRITGAVLLGQAAAFSLVLSFGWQTVRLRRAIAHPDEQTDLSGFSLLTWVQDRLGKKTKPLSPPVSETPPPRVETPEISPQLQETVIIESAIAELSEPEIPQTPLEEIITSELETPEIELEPQGLVTQEETPSIEPQPVVKPQEEPKKKGFSLKGLFGFGKSKSKPPVTKPSPVLEEPTAVIEEEEWEDSETPLEASQVTVTTTVISEIIPEETNWEDTEQAVNVVTSKIILEETTEVIEAEEKAVIAVTPEITLQESEEKDAIALTPEITPQESETKDEIEFEPFLGDDETETVIESYEPKNIAPSSVQNFPDIVKPIATSETEKIEESPLISEEKKDS